MRDKKSEIKLNGPVECSVGKKQIVTDLCLPKLCVQGGRSAVRAFRGRV